MRIALIAALALSSLARSPAAEPNQLTPDEIQGGWRLLFDGKTTQGWQEITGKPFPSNCWTIENQCLKAVVRTDGAQDIRTVDTFRSFDLQFDWMMGKAGNSGVKYLIQRVDEWTNKIGRQARARGLEYQLAGDENPDASSDPRRAAASLYSAIAPLPKTAPLIGAFNHSRLLIQGRHVEHWLNGVKVVEFETAAPEVQKLFHGMRPKNAPDAPAAEQGPISLQNHGSETWFRNIKIRDLR
jgi:hypothetical protein